jgi:hypothetical protein
MTTLKPVFCSIAPQTKTRAEVRYCLSGVGVGVEFIDLAPEAQRAIEEEMVALCGVS